MRIETVRPGRRPPAGLVGAVLARDLRVGGERWTKGRRLSAADLDSLAAAPLDLAAAETTVLRLEPGELHEDDAALRLAEAVRGPGLAIRGPSQSRVDLVAEHDGVVHVRVPLLERIDRLDPLEVFTVLDGQAVAAGDLVASVKVAPHVVPESVVAAGERMAAGERGGAAGPVVRVAPYRSLRVAALVKESVAGTARERFEASVRAKVESLGSALVAVAYVPDDADAVTDALEILARGPRAVDLVLTAGGASTDPTDAFYVAIERLGGRVVRHGVPAHPGSMLWLARIGPVGILGLPTCGAYSKATAADLILPRLLTGEPVTRATVARLGHGGILVRSMRFRFPPYARDLDAPDG
jgi:hypothetical protein